jgi:paired amphipathic helix protein Sin3a
MEDESSNKDPPPLLNSTNEGRMIAPATAAAQGNPPLETTAETLVMAPAVDTTMAMDSDDDDDDDDEEDAGPMAQTLDATLINATTATTTVATASTLQNHHVNASSSSSWMEPSASLVATTTTTTTTNAAATTANENATNSESTTIQQLNDATTIHFAKELAAGKEAVDVAMEKEEIAETDATRTVDNQEKETAGFAEKETAGAAGESVIKDTTTAVQVNVEATNTTPAFEEEEMKPAAAAAAAETVIAAPLSIQEQTGEDETGGGVKEMDIDSNATGPTETVMKPAAAATTPAKSPSSVSPSVVPATTTTTATTYASALTSSVASPAKTSDAHASSSAAMEATVPMDEDSNVLKEDGTTTQPTLPDDATMATSASPPTTAAAAAAPGQFPEQAPSPAPAQELVQQQQQPNAASPMVDSPSAQQSLPIQQQQQRAVPPPPPPQAAAMMQQQQQQPNSNNNNGQWRELRVEDALNYLDHVKMEFKDRPKVYNQFLAIMKNFKSQEVDTPGVIRMVSKLFRGYNNLILGFNTFLPDGYKISLADLERQEAEERAQEAAAEEYASSGGSPGKMPANDEQRATMQVNYPPWAAAAGRMAAAVVAGATQHSSPPQQQQQLTSLPQPDMRKPPPDSVAAQAKAPPAAQAAGQQQQRRSPPVAGGGGGHQAVEFDHAISYVTKIKRRFANDPSTYHKFLEILHTYQKEQRGIKEVLEQVAHLFQDHPDLLKEFTFFLPDAVQEQAKERLHRAAAESESRMAKAHEYQQQQQLQQRIPMHGNASQQKFIDMTARNQGLFTDSNRKRSLDGGESVVYNSAVERQFFDAAREALSSHSRDGGQAWAEFIKCLDMYAQDILSKSEMLNFVEPLLGKRNTKLFEEFKRILNAAGSLTHPLPFMEDSWYSVPLSEIDFSRCRRCSPSYRALPRDYPAPPCGDRTEEERMVLNDIWVSLPVGSEESYTFRHMRRNTYEETLFRVEDERFEIDMAIDSNAATLHRLEPIAEEIASLAQGDPMAAEFGHKNADAGGIGGRRFQYTFDKSILGVIHRNSICRIYGDAGAEMLELLQKNPTVAVPLVVDRLRQKATEWCAARERLNRSWKELAQHNYYRSLDHRGLTWRAADKRTTSTRTLVSEIKDRAAHGGKEGPEALKLKLDKAKEEHGTFYEVTMKEALSKNLDLTFLPKPDRRLFTPHMSVMYENNSWAQRDAYRILAFALERGPTTPVDKERCHRMWIEFFGPFFGLDMNWMERPAVTYMESHAAPNTPAMLSKATVVSDNDDDDESMEDVAGKNVTVVTEELRQNGTPDANGREFTDYHPLPPGAHVSTLYGEGKIIEFRRTDNIYVVQLQFGSTGYLRPPTVLCSILPVEKSAYTRELCSGDLSKLARPGDQLIIGTQSLYLFFCLHQILIRRLNIAKRLAYEVGQDPALKTLVEQMPDKNKNAVGRRRYEAYLSLVYGLLDGGVGGPSEGDKYEDRVRALLGHGSYELATMDKLISHIWKNIQTMAGDETMWNLIQLYRRHLKSANGFQPEAFRQEAAYQSEGEQMYAFQYCPMPGEDKAVLHMEYVGVMEDENDASDEDEDSASDEGQQDQAGSTEPASKRVKR